MQIQNFYADTVPSIRNPIDSIVLSAYMKLHSKLQLCHQGTKTQRDDMYFNLGALASLWLNE